MICPSCKQETEEGKFCTNCGAKLPNANTEDAAADEPITLKPHTTEEPKQESTQQTTQQTQPQETNHYVEKFKQVCTDFGQFSLTLIKHPNEAKQTDQTHYISGLITLVIFAVIISLNNYISVVNEASGWGDIPFLEGFVVPLLKHILMLGAIAIIIFAAAKVALQEVSVLDIFAKYGAYLVPFILLFIVHVIFNLIKLTQPPFDIVGTISILGPVLIVPVLIIIERSVKGLDRVYMIIAVSFLSYVVYNYLYVSMIQLSLDIFN